MGSQTTNGAQAQSITVTRLASGAIAEGEIVTLHTTAGEVIKATTEATGFGIAVSDAADGDPVAICVAGPCRVKCGEAFSSLTGAPTWFTNDTSGQAHAAATGQRTVGYILPTTRSGTAYADLDLADCVVFASTYYVP